MKRFLFFALSVVGTTTARAADIATTYSFSPDLSLEGNRIVTSAGMNFPVIVALNIAVVTVFALCTLYWWRAPLSCSLPEGRDDLWAFASHNYFGRVHGSTTFVWRFLTTWPKNWRMALQLVGVAGPISLIAVSCLAIFSWFALHSWHWSWYRAIYGRVFFLFPYGLVLPLFGYVTFRFFLHERRRCSIEEHVA